MSHFDKINNFEYEQPAESNNKLMAQDYHELPDQLPNSPITQKDYLIVYQWSPTQLKLISSLEISRPVSMEPIQGGILNFCLAKIADQYYLAVLDTLEEVDLYHIDFQLQVRKVSSFKLDKQFNCEKVIVLASLDQFGFSFTQLNLLTIIDCKNPSSPVQISTSLTEYVVQCHPIIQHSILLVLTQQEKVIVLNLNTLQHINEHNIKHSSLPCVSMIPYEYNNDLNPCLYLLTLTASNKITLWHFRDSDFHKSILQPLQTLKIKSSQKLNGQNQLLGFTMESTQNFLFVAYKLDSQVVVYMSLLDSKMIKSKNFSGKCVVTKIKEFYLDSPQSSSFNLITVPQALNQDFASGVQFKNEVEFLNYQRQLRELPYDESILDSENCCGYIIVLESSLNEELHKIYWYWCYPDFVYEEYQSEIKSIKPQSLLQKGSKTLPQSQLSNVLEQQMKSSSQAPESRQEIKAAVVHTQEEPVQRAYMIFEKDLIPKMQQAKQQATQALNLQNSANQLHELCIDVRNELSEDPEFMLLVKDMIEDQIRKELDKSSQVNLHDNNQLQKLEQQLKNDLQQLETQMEQMITQNLDMYIMTCESFIADNFNSTYFEQLIEERIQQEVRHHINQQISQQDSLSEVQEIASEYFKEHLTPLYEAELQKLSEDIKVLFEQIATYFRELHYSEQVKQQNLNQIIDSLNQQLATINKNIITMIEKTRPDALIIQKLDGVIAQTEQLLKHGDEGKLGVFEQKPPTGPPPLFSMLEGGNQQPQQQQQLQNQTNHQIKLSQQQQLQYQQQSQQQQQQNSNQIEVPSEPRYEQRLSKLEDHILQLRNDILTFMGQQNVLQQPKQSNGKFGLMINNMANQLTFMQKKLMQPDIQVSQVSEILQQLIQHFNFFILQADQS